MKTIIMLALMIIFCACEKDYGDEIGYQRTPDGNSPFGQLQAAFGGATISPELRRYVEQTRDNEKDKYKIVIVTDEADESKANLIANAFRTEQPWSLFNIQTQVIKLSKEELDCAEGKTITRLLEADRAQVSRLAARHNADQAIIVCSMDYGGAGGDVPIVAANNRAVETAFHEFMHTLGFSDEYEYSASEAQIYCGDEDDLTRVNLAKITPLATYPSDSLARVTHRSAIPWYGHIESTTLITHVPELGTDSSRSNVFGLFEAVTCNNATPAMKLWKPGSARSIMQSTTSGSRIDGIYSTILFDILVDKGVPLRDLPADRTERTVLDGGRNATSSSVTAAPTASRNGVISR